MDNIKGTKIRFQFFDSIIYAYIAIILFIFIIITEFFLIMDGFLFQKILEILYTCLKLLLIITPLIPLSILNKFFFGRIICIISEDGIYYEDRLIEWNELSNLRYIIPDYLSRRFWRFYSSGKKTARIEASYKGIGIPKIVDIMSAPFYSLFVIKRYSPKTKIKGFKILLVAFVGIIFLTAILTLAFKFK